MEDKWQIKTTLTFFAFELRAKRFYETTGIGSILLNAMYGLLSDYGRSVARPVAALSFVVIVSAIAVAITRWTNFCDMMNKVVPLLTIAFTNSMLLLGAEKSDLRSKAFYELCEPCSKGFGIGGELLAYGQSAVSILLLFLIGLGLRNRFRVGGGGG